MEAGKGKPELRKDSVNNRWVIFSPARSRRPSDFKSKNPNPNHNNYQSDSCPFCIGRESECAPEIFRFSRDSVDNWTIRVIQNLYPALSRELEEEEREMEVGPGRMRLGGFGFHDVVIESPVHSVHLPDLEAKEIGEVFLAYKKRILEIMSFPSIQYVQVFKNHGASAGASMSHSHSQLLGIPVIPPLVAARISSMKENFDQTGNCSLCEIRQEELLIEESTHFIAIAPFASSYPFEIWIVPREHSSHFYGIDSDKAIDLGRLLKLMLKKMALQLNNPPYNFMVHSSPLHATREQLPYSHWYLQIVPQLSVKAGFEIGSGCDINPVFPEDAAKILRELSLPK